MVGLRLRGAHAPVGEVPVAARAHVAAHDEGQPAPLPRRADLEHEPDAAAVRVGEGERSFKRRFRQATGLSPLEYAHRVRLEEAKQMLEAGDEPVEAIAEQVGYEDAGFFSWLFRRSVGLTPARYRKRFRGMRRALARV
ncbi:MAG TPA: helix-turn-helix transcriptional regulator [Burkholderiales bacterium]|nr:helix-turn-helix transcriptional regulator [Burkholderiales bacterium]